MIQVDPRTKLLLAIACAVVLFLTRNTIALAIEFSIVILLVLSLRLSAAWLKLLRVLLPMMLFFVIVMLFSFDLATVIGAALRLAAVSTTFFIFFKTTAPEDLANSLVKSGVPYAFAFILTTAMEFIPVLTQKMQDVMDAQRARGIRLESDLGSIRNYTALFAPLLIQSFTLADQLAEAMESRGFGAPHRSFAREYALRRMDYAVIGVALLFVLIGWQMR